LGIEVKNRVPRLSISDQDEKLAGEILLRHGVQEDKPLIFIHPGCGSIKKAWPSLHFAKLARNLQKRFSVRIAVIEGPADRAQAETLYKRLKGVSTVKMGKLPLRTLAALMKRVKCFIGNDSGITHLAAAVGTPAIALFGPTDPGVWGPRGENVSIIRGETDCSPCTLETLRGCTRQRCLENISVETVYKVIERII
jgi:ADP-heptose:LPS heptosyltransferase